MGDDHAPSKRKLSELRVIDLKSELEKRGLDKNGVKTALTERLVKALQEEGKNPDEYLFEVAAEKTPSKVPLKRSSRKAKESDSEVANEEEEEEEEKQEEEEDHKESVKEDSKDVEKAESQEKTSDLEVQKNAQCNGSDTEDSSKAGSVNSHLSPPKPETVPVVAPLTVEDVLRLDSSKLKPCDNDSLIVNPDETQSDIDSSVNERDSMTEETVQEETSENSSKNSKTDNEDSVIPMDTDENIAQALQCNKEETKTNVKSSGNVNSTSETAISETSTANNKQKSSEKSGNSEKDTSGKRSIILISNDSVKRVAASSKNLWVSGLAEKTRANDLKSLFSKFGKVSGAKIVTNAKTPGTRCYGFITMATSEEALICIEKLNRTELHGRIIAVEKTTREPTGSIKRADLKSIQSKTHQKKVDKVSESSEGKKSEAVEKNAEKSESAKAEKAKSDKVKSSEKKASEKSKTEKKATENLQADEKSKDESETVKEDEGKKDGKKSTPSREKDRSRDRSRDKKRREKRSRSRERISFRGGFFRRGFGRGFGFRPYIPRNNFVDSRHRRERDRERERELDRRRFSDLRQRDIERKNKEESLRLERERERLRIEREKLERERAEVLRLEREKQRLERERLEREKAELRKRTQLTLDDRRGTKRGFDGPRKDIDTFWDDRKRHAGRRDSSLEPPDNFGDYGRDRGVFDRRSDRFESRSKGDDISPFSTSGRREGRHEHDSFHRGSRNSRDLPDRGRDDWKGKPGRDRNFDRPGRNSFNDRSRNNFERPHPWEGGPPEREQNKFENPPPIGNSQWAPVNKAPENWGRLDQPPQERWGALDHARGQPGMNIGHPPNLGHPPNPIVFGGAPGNDMMAPMPGHFPVDRFNSNMMRRF